MNEYFESIIVPIDFENEKTSKLIKQAYVFGQLMNLDIVLMHVYNEQTEIETGESFSSIEYKLNDIAKTSSDKYGHNFFAVLKKGKVAECVIEFSEENYARLIIMGNIGVFNGSPEKDYSISRSTNSIIRRAQCPVLTVNSDIIYDLEKMLLPLDISKPIGKKLFWAVQISKLFGCIIKIITIASKDVKIEINEIEEKLKNIKSSLNDRNVFCTTEILCSNCEQGEVGVTITNYAEENNCDLIMIMTRQENLNSNFHVGRTASKIISISKKPIINIASNIKV